MQLDEVYWIVVSGENNKTPSIYVGVLQNGCLELNSG
jgi:hypothetical protein